jgi:formylglycine-generating enzyme required for sulfatase activity
MMGAPEDEAGGKPSERPAHKVSIARRYAVAKFELTFDEWDACVALGGCAYRPPDPQSWGRGQRPVINVSWEDAQNYVAWLAQRTGKPYRLLSEAEWERAARADSENAYAWGDEIGKGTANCDGCGTQWDDKETAPVGSFAPNGFGLHDMHGNVQEWVQDCFHDNYEGAPDDGSAWTTSCAGGRKVLRGGSWYHDPRKDLRSASRIALSAGYQSNHNGIRVGRTLSGEQ